MDFWSRCRQYTWVLGVLGGVLFLGIGVSLGQFDMIWQKAVMICLECIGIG